MHCPVMILIVVIVQTFAQFNDSAAEEAEEENQHRSRWIKNQETELHHWIVIKSLDPEWRVNDEYFTNPIENEMLARNPMQSSEEGVMLTIGLRQLPAEQNGNQSGNGHINEDRESGWRSSNSESHGDEAAEYLEYDTNSTSTQDLPESGPLLDANPSIEYEPHPQLESESPRPIDFNWNPIELGDNLDYIDDLEPFSDQNGGLAGDADLGVLSPNHPCSTQMHHPLYSPCRGQYNPNFGQPSQLQGPSMASLLMHEMASAVDHTRYYWQRMKPVKRILLRMYFEWMEKVRARIMERIRAWRSPEEAEIEEILFKLNGMRLNGN